MLKNPYLDEFKKIKGDKHISFDDILNDTNKLYTNRYDYCFKYAFAVPDENAIKTIAKYSPIIELGAGNGYWAWLLQQQGVNIKPYDNYSWNQFKTPYTVIEKGNENILLSQPRHINLMLCWPDYAEPFAFNCAVNFQGKYIIYIGEGSGGCTGDDSFHNYLSEYFHLKEKVYIPQWWGLHDDVYIYERIK